MNPYEERESDTSSRSNQTVGTATPQIKKTYQGKCMDLVLAPDPRLRQPLEKFVFDGQVDARQLASDFYATMVLNGGAGLAANQVGLAFRAFMVTDDKGQAEMCYNPKIISTGEETETIREGCLSYPDIFIPIKRPTEITMRYQDWEGNFKTVRWQGRLARVTLHEMEHLDGQVFYRTASRFHREQVEKKIKLASRKKSRETINRGL